MWITLTYLCILGTCKYKAARLESLIARHSLEQANIIDLTSASSTQAFTKHTEMIRLITTVFTILSKPCGCRIGIRLSDSWLKMFQIFLLSWIYSWEKSNVHTWQHPDLDSTYISSCEHTGSTTFSNRYIPTCVSRILVNHAQYSNYLMNTRIEYSIECSLSFLSTIFSMCLCSCNSLHGISQWRSILCANDIFSVHVTCHYVKKMFRSLIIYGSISQGHFLMHLWSATVYCQLTHPQHLHTVRILELLHLYSQSH